MNESMSKRLAEFIGVCWHEWQGEWMFNRCKHCNTTRGYHSINPDFTTPDSWQLIADEIEKRGEWVMLYRFLPRLEEFCNWSVIERIMWFHEKKPAEKSTIVAAWLEEVER